MVVKLIASGAVGLALGLALGGGRAPPSDEARLGRIEERLTRIEAAVEASDVRGPLAKLEAALRDASARQARAAGPWTSLTIGKLYWFDSAERPDWIARTEVAADGSGHLLARVEEVRPGGVDQYSAFYDCTDHTFTLEAPGAPSVPVHAERGMWMQDFYLRITPADMHRLQPGTAYALVPRNAASRCPWRVREGVHIALAD